MKGLSEVEVAGGLDDSLLCRIRGATGVGGGGGGGGGAEVIKLTSRSSGRGRGSGGSRRRRRGAAPSEKHDFGLIRR